MPLKTTGALRRALPKQPLPFLFSILPLISMTALLFLSASCAVSGKYYDVVPDKEKKVYSRSLKVSVKYKGERKKQGFKILLKYDGEKDKMLFLSPLNQVYGILWVENERALFINNRKKKYWKGPFNLLLQEMWGMDFDYREFRRLMVQRELPPGNRLKDQNIKVTFEKSRGSSEVVRIIAPDVRVRVKISNPKTRAGRLRFSDKSIDGMKETALRVLLTDG